MATHIKPAQATQVESAPSLDEVGKAYITWLEEASKLGNEAFRFANDRFAKDLEAATQLMRCNDPGEAFKLQAEFANELAGDYLTESRKMFEWVSHLVATDQVKARQSGSGRQHAR